jgi:hypothetical protein
MYIVELTWYFNREQSPRLIHRRKGPRAKGKVKMELIKLDVDVHVLDNPVITNSNKTSLLNMTVAQLIKKILIWYELQAFVTFKMWSPKTVVLKLLILKAIGNDKTLFFMDVQCYKLQYLLVLRN